jgi:hypothetical protein
MTCSRQNLEADFLKNKVSAALLCVVDQLFASFKNLFAQSCFTLQTSPKLSNIKTLMNSETESKIQSAARKVDHYWKQKQDLTYVSSESQKEQGNNRPVLAFLKSIEQGSKVCAGPAWTKKGPPT